MYNEDQPTEPEDSSKMKRKMEETPRTSRRKLLRRKIQRTVPETEETNEQDVTSAEVEPEFLINPQSSKILSSHKAMELASQSEVPETAYYPSPQGQNFMICMPMSDGMPVAPEYIPLSSPQLPPMDCPEEDLESHQYQEIMQMLVQAIHNQNRIMEECKNILTSIHHAITPATATPSLQPPPPPVLPQQPVNNSSSITQNPQPAHIMPLWNPTKEGQPIEEPHQLATPSLQLQQQLQKAAESQSKSAPTATTMTKAQSNNSGYRKQPVKNEPKEMQQPQAASVSLPQPPAINLQTVSSSKEPDKPTVYGPDDEFSSAYLRYVYSKSSTATSFANVLMKEVFTLEERISSNCNGVMGKKALEAERLDKIKRAVKRFYTDSEDEFQDLWKKCRKSIDSTNRNLKFVIMKKPTL